jgi:hypothetical protein
LLVISEAIESMAKVLLAKLPIFQLVTKIDPRRRARKLFAVLKELLVADRLSQAQFIQLSDQKLRFP